MKTTHTILAILLTLTLGRASHAQQPTQQVQVTESPAVPPTLNTELSAATRLLQTAGSVSLSHSGKMLVIPTTPMNTNQREEIAEDMQIMGRIFAMKSPLLVSKRNSFESMILSYQILEISNHPSTGLEGIYLQDFGALFFMNATIPLLPPDQSQEKVTKEKKDTLWEKTRQELTTVPDDIRKFYFYSSSKKKKQKPQTYDAESVQKLENGLIGSLKYAANIRHLQPNDRIILYVQGNPGQQGHLTIQAKWSDIKAYHAGKINTDAFKKKVVKIMLITKDSSSKPHPARSTRPRPATRSSRPLGIRPDSTDAPR